VLGGAPGVGKTAVGPAVAAALGWRLVDVDALIERAAGGTVAEVFAREGEAGFRARERAALREALDAERVVITAGAGALVDRARRHVVTLRAPVEALRARLAGGAERPLLREAGALEALLAARRGAYAEAHAEVDAAGPVAAVAAAVAACAAAALPLVVPLGERSYRVHIGPLRALGARDFAALVTDANVARHWGDAAARALGGAPARVVLRPGERSKTLASAARVWTALGAGGGVVTDVGGFAAATWLRGVAYVSVPTSLLAMVDASVGGKTGVDLAAGKNLVGAFHQPSLVWIDPALLATLPMRHYRAALAEVVKVAAVRDAALLAWLEANATTLAARPGAAALARGGPVEEMIRRAVRAKIDVVADDEREDGARALLNFGHTVGHALEAGARYRALHGDCVAAGMRAELRLGVAVGVTAGELRKRLLDLMDALGLARSIAADGAAAQDALRFDKKRENKAFRVSLVTGPGRGETVTVAARDLMRSLRGVIEIR
jgi:shikimate kinase/3-dehydroquinate synthase